MVTGAFNDGYTTVKHAYQRVSVMFYISKHINIQLINVIMTINMIIIMITNKIIIMINTMIMVPI